MPANLPPVYKAAEQRFREAKTVEDKIAALQEMMAIIPKHKGTDKLRADLIKARPYLMIVVIQGTDDNKATHKILGEGSFDMVPLVRTLAETLDLQFSRIQFTPDLMPADIIGTNMVMEDESGKRFFEFQKGPIFTQICLADEINRATPKTQSALLEAMQEKSVSVAGNVFKLEPPFFVMATQNPLEMEGTFPLPEPQLDRFLFKLLVGPPSVGQIEQILDRTTEGEPPVVTAVVDGRRILQMRDIARRVPIAPDDRRLGVTAVAACDRSPTLRIRPRRMRHPC